METLFFPSFVRDRIRFHLEKRIDNLQKGYRQNVGLIGMPGMGKTYLVSSIYESALQREKLLPIYIKSGWFHFDHFVECWIGAILSSIFVSQSKTPSENFASLIDAAEPLVPRTVERIRNVKKLMRMDKNLASLKELFALPSVLAEETGKKVLLILDEFQELESLPVPDPFSWLGREIMVAKNILYLVTSSVPQHALEIFHDKLSLLFGNFEIIDLKPLGFSETATFMQDRFPNNLFSLPQTRFFIRMTDGNPLYLDLLLDQLQNLVPREFPSTIDPSFLIEAFQRELFDEHGRIALMFEKNLELCRRLSKESSPYVLALLAISDGRRKLPGISAYIGKKMTETKKVLQRLVAENMIVKRGAFYMLEDPLFRFWLKKVYEKRQHLYGPATSSVRQGLGRALADILQEMEKHDEIDITARIEQLFKEFRNDVVEINQKKVPCPHFLEISFRPANGRVFPLTARGPRGRWLCQIAKEKISEEDVIFFLEESRRFRKNVHRRILVTLNGIDLNAKLMAQEARIQLWDLRDFNTLLDLYDLPKMILMDKPVLKENHGQNMGSLAQSVHTA